jgi:hypothetical protein
MVLEKAEREKQAIEQKKQKDQLLKERMMKIKELVGYYNKYLVIETCLSVTILLLE